MAIEGDAEIVFTIDDPSRYMAALSPFGKYFEILGYNPTNTVEDIDNFVFPQDTEDTLRREISILEEWDVLGEVSEEEHSGVYGGVYRPKDEEAMADALFSWKEVKKAYSGIPYRLIEDTENEFDDLRGNLSFF